MLNTYILNLLALGSRAIIFNISEYCSLTRLVRAIFKQHTFHGHAYMKKSTKAVLLSAFIFPGAGHVYLKKYSSGIALLCASLAAIYYMISQAVEESLRIVEQMQNGSVQPDVAAVMELASKQPAGSEAYLVNIASAVLLICWVIGIIDSYRVGRVSDNDDAA
ncbi:MAG: hypothetical protein LJE83_07580 [Gammaproteobacteria bacterium]|nr:hypothetical protein [Gammaproteobacteria bacterium]